MYDYEKIKELTQKAAAEERGCSLQTQGGSNEDARPNLRDRIARQSARAQAESRNVERLAELEYLLDKHPDFARIFDLLDLVKG